nr:MAG TPA: hypothetical protein [Caudoviricetes sp.]
MNYPHRILLSLTFKEICTLTENCYPNPNRIMLDTPTENC